MTWFASNRWYLLAVAVLLPVAILVALNAGWFTYEQNRAGRPIPAIGGETVEYGGTQWSLLESHSFGADTDAGRAAGLLPGTSLITATVGVRPGPEPTGCDFELTDAAGIRSWDEAGYSDADFDIADGAESYCDSAAEGPYRVQVYFVVPDDAAAHAQLRLSTLMLLPDQVVFRL